MPYIQDFGGKASIIPIPREITKNFVLSVYSSQEAIDTDDGSSYYHTHDNFFVYAANGLKSDFGGHDNRHYRNVYAYVGDCWGGGNMDWFINNTCVTKMADSGYHPDCPGHGPNPYEIVTGNTVYNQDGVLKGKICGATVAKWPSDEALVAMGKKVLGV